MRRLHSVDRGPAATFHLMVTLFLCGDAMTGGRRSDPGSPEQSHASGAAYVGRTEYVLLAEQANGLGSATALIRSPRPASLADRFVRCVENQLSKDCGQDSDERQCSCCSNGDGARQPTTVNHS
jgi:hypothetical protein